MPKDNFPELRNYVPDVDGFYAYLRHWEIVVVDLNYPYHQSMAMQNLNKLFKPASELT